MADRIKWSGKVASNGVSDVTLVAAPGSGKRVAVRTLQVENRGNEGTLTLESAGATELYATAFPKIDATSTVRGEQLDDLVGADKAPQIVAAENEAVTFKLDRAGSDVRVACFYEVLP